MAENYGDLIAILNYGVSRHTVLRTPATLYPRGSMLSEHINAWDAAAAFMTISGQLPYEGLKAGKTLTAAQTPDHVLMNTNQYIEPLADFIEATHQDNLRKERL